MHANHREEINDADTGAIVAALGLKDTFTGDTICDPSTPLVLENIRFPEPVISVAVEPKTRADQDKLGEALRKMSDEDPTFKVTYNDETGQIVISGMGELHLDVIVSRMLTEFSVSAKVGNPEVAYKETITDSGRMPKADLFGRPAATANSVMYGCVLNLWKRAKDLNLWRISRVGLFPANSSVRLKLVLKKLCKTEY